MPTLNTVTPNSGPIGGGTSVTLTGTGLTGASSVTFGGVSATGWTINSPTQITATIPAGNAGVVNVSVTTAAGSASLTNAFTYIAPPVAGPVSASVGHNSSANPVTLSLSGRRQQRGHQYRSKPRHSNGQRHQRHLHTHGRLCRHGQLHLYRHQQCRHLCPGDRDRYRRFPDHQHRPCITACGYCRYRLQHHLAGCQRGNAPYAFRLHLEPCPAA
ncbi:IPT/TIG domain-containing protein [Pseudomonas qingdaonensis]|nr:IPT/TIG domain-containing protein [Pseudomonas qingdaonensis]